MEHSVSLRFPHTSAHTSPQPECRVMVFFSCRLESIFIGSSSISSVTTGRIAARYRSSLFNRAIPPLVHSSISISHSPSHGTFPCNWEKDSTHYFLHPRTTYFCLPFIHFTHCTPCSITGVTKSRLEIYLQDFYSQYIEIPRSFQSPVTECSAPFPRLVFSHPLQCSTNARCGLEQQLIMCY